MTQKDKQEIGALLDATFSRANACALGIDADTARELIQFAQTWKTCRKSLLVGVITVVIAGIIGALWTGVKSTIKQ